MDTADSSLNDINTLSFEEALKELEQIVKRLENGESTLDETVKDYERGTALRQHCEAKLRDAQMKIEQMTLPKERTNDSSSSNDDIDPDNIPF